jgi:putative MATE family efflux protein
MQAADNPRLHALLNAPIGPLLSRLAAPNIVVLTVQTLVTIADAWFVGRLGVTALASLAIVFPVQTMMLMMSAGAMGGGISSAVARALGAGDQARADAITLHAIVIAVLMAAAYLVIAAIFAEPLFRLLGGQGPVLAGAVAYAEIAFGAGIAMWLANSFASIIRGTGNMALPAAVMIVTSVIQVALAGGLTLGWGPLPALGLRGPAVALVISFAIAALVLGAFLAAGRLGVRLAIRGTRLRGALFHDIVKVGGVACGNAFLTIATVLIVTRLAAAHGTAALAGYGLGSRLELILIPIAFGAGGVLTAAVGTNFGARQYARARRFAWTGGLAVGAFTGLIGIAAAIWPALWLGIFTSDAGAFAFGGIYLRIAGPMYGMFGLGMALYFASQGTGNMAWPFSAGVLRLIVAAGGGWAAVAWFGAGPAALFAFVSAGLFVFGGVIAVSLFSRVWDPER